MGKIENGNEGACGMEKKIADWCWRVVKRHFMPNNVFFEEGDCFLKLNSKYLPLDENESITVPSETETFPCGHARCCQTFNSLIQYEAHYHVSHRHVCGTCHRTFPSAHLLDIHILETHGVMFSLVAKRTEMYQCLIEGCKEKFSDGKHRHQHLIKYHHYPSNYRYRHSDGKLKTSKSDKGQSVQSRGESMETESSSILHERNRKPLPAKFKPRVPPNICFGQGVSRGFQKDYKKHKKPWHAQKKGNKITTIEIENVDMSDMSEALKDT